MSCISLIVLSTSTLFGAAVAPTAVCCVSSISVILVYISVRLLARSYPLLCSNFFSLPSTSGIFFVESWSLLSIFFITLSTFVSTELIFCSSSLASYSLWWITLLRLYCNGSSTNTCMWCYGLWDSHSGGGAVLDTLHTWDVLMIMCRDFS